MKKQFLLAMLSVCMSTMSFGQITFEHTYNSSSTYSQLVLFSSNGEKYMAFDSVNVNLYNTDHTLWKTIHASSYAGYKLTYVYAVSDNLFNSDNMVELFAVYNSNITFPRYRGEIINENTVVIQSMDSAYSANVHYNATTNTYKLFTNYFHIVGSYLY